MFYKFKKNDVFVNSLKTHPSYEIFVHSGSVKINQKQSEGSSVSSSHLSMYEMNVDRHTEEGVYGFTFQNKGVDDVAIQFDDSLEPSLFVPTASYPHTATLQRFLFNPASKDTYKANLPANGKQYSGVLFYEALKNTLNSYNIYSTLFNHDLYSNSTINLIDIPSVFYGQSIKKGSVKLKYFYTGTLIAEAADIYENGVLIFTTGSYVPLTGSAIVSGAVGLVMYNEGILFLTGSETALGGNLKKTVAAVGVDGPTGKDMYINRLGANVYEGPKWKYFMDGAPPVVRTGSAHAPPGQAMSSSFLMEFEGVHEVPVLTMFAHAPKGELNHSNNMTYVQSASNGSPYQPITSSMSFKELDNVKIKNTVSSSYPTLTSSFKKQTFISQVGIFDDKKRLIGIAKVGVPVRKSEEQDYTFKLKLDL